MECLVTGPVNGAPPIDRMGRVWGGEDETRPAVGRGGGRQGGVPAHHVRVRREYPKWVGCDPFGRGLYIPVYNICMVLSEKRCEHWFKNSAQ